MSIRFKYVWFILRPIAVKKSRNWRSSLGKSNAVPALCTDSYTVVNAKDIFVLIGNPIRNLPHNKFIVVNFEMLLQVLQYIELSMHRDSECLDSN